MCSNVHKAEHLKQLVAEIRAAVAKWKARRAQAAGQGEAAPQGS